MRITLSTIRCPPGLRPDQREASGGEISLGRSPDNTWVLHDPTRHLSKRHCVLAWRADGWRVTDLSANGTFLNDDPAPLGQGESRDLRSGDRIRIGLYELEVRLENPFLESAPEDMSIGIDTGAGDPPGIAVAPSGDGSIPDRWWEKGAGEERPQRLAERGHEPVERWVAQMGSIDTPPSTELRQPPPAGPAGDALATLLTAAGMPELRPADPAAVVQALGRAFREMVAGLRQVLIARAEIKGLFRIEQTTIRARGNNPLKFSATDEDALAALLGAGRRTDMGADEAVADALRDIRLHEVAVLDAMQAALRTLLDRLSPASIEAGAGSGGLSLLPWQREARLWGSYEALHAGMLQALSDDFDSVFGKAFARAYEQALYDAERGS